MNLLLTFYGTQRNSHNINELYIALWNRTQYQKRII